MRLSLGSSGGGGCLCWQPNHLRTLTCFRLNLISRARCTVTVPARQSLALCCRLAPIHALHTSVVAPALTYPPPTSSAASGCATHPGSEPSPLLRSGSGPPAPCMRTNTSGRAHRNCDDNECTYEFLCADMLYTSRLAPPMLVRTLRSGGPSWRGVCVRSTRTCCTMRAAQGNRL